MWNQIKYKLVLLLISIAACLLPMFIYKHLDNSTVDMLEDLPVVHIQNSQKYMYSLVAGIAVSFPILLELVADSWTYMENPLALFSKWILLMALVIPNIIILTVLPYDQNYNGLPIIYNIRLILIVFAFMCAFLAYGSPIWTPRNTTTVVVVFSFGIVIDSFEAFNGELAFLAWPRLFLVLAITIYGLYYGYRYISQLQNKLVKWSDITLDDYCCCTHTFGIVIFIIGVWVLTVLYSGSDWAHTPVDFYVISSYLEIFYTAVLTVWHSRIVRRDLAIAHVSHIYMPY